MAGSAGADGTALNSAFLPSSLHKENLTDFAPSTVVVMPNSTAPPPNGPLPGSGKAHPQQQQQQQQQPPLFPPQKFASTAQQRANGASSNGLPPSVVAPPVGPNAVSNGAGSS